jgi:hypothetical protein
MVGLEDKQAISGSQGGGNMKTWQMGVIGAALAMVMTACPSGRGAGDARAVFPVKSGETWAATFTINGSTATVGFQLDGAPEYDDDGDVIADFATTSNVAGGFGYVLTEDNIFVAQFVVNRQQKTGLLCGAQNGSNFGNPVRGAGFAIQDGKQAGSLTCTLQRIR